MSIPPVIIDFKLRGVPEVMQAFRSVSDRLVESEKASTAETLRQARVRVTEAQREAKEREAAARKAEQAAVKETERGAKERAAAEARERKEREASYAAMFKQLESQERTATKAADREAKERAQAAEREAKSITRAADRESKERTRAAEREEAEKERAMERLERTAARFQRQMTRDAEREEKKRENAALTALRRVDAHREHVARTLGGAGGHAISGLINRGTTLAATAMGMAGGLSVGDVVSKRFEDEKLAAQLINATTTSGTAPQGATVENILGKASATAIETGMEKSDVISGALAYSRKARGGDFAGAMANMGFFATMSKVTGANVEDIAGAAGTLQSQNQNLTAPQMRQMLLDVYAQGKAGSMSMVDVAKQIGVLASTRSAYAGTAADNQRKLLALGQLAAPEGSVEEAGTFIKDLTMEAGKHRKSTKKLRGLESMGVKFNELGQMESPEQMIESVFRGTKGDITKISELFGARGTAIFRALQPAFAQAGGGEKGIEAVRKTMAGVTGATMTEEDLNKQHAVVMNTDAERFHDAMIKLQDSLEHEMTPMIERFAAKLPELLPEFEKIIKAGGELAEWFIENPFKGLGLLVAAAVTKDIAAAAIGEAVKTSLSGVIKAMLSAAGGAPGVPGAAGVPGGAAGAAGLTAGAATGIVAALAVTGVEGKNMVDAALGGQTAGQKRAGELAAMAQNAKTPEERAAVQRELVEARKQTGLGGLFKAGLAASNIGAATVEHLVGLTKKNTSLSEITHIFSGRALAENEKGIQDVLSGKRNSPVLHALNAAAPATRATEGHTVPTGAHGPSREAVATVASNDKAVRVLESIDRKLGRQPPRAPAVSNPQHPARTQSL